MLGSNKIKLCEIGQIFVMEALLEKSAAALFSEQAQTEQLSLIQYIIQNNILSAQTIAQTLSQSLRAPLFDLDTIEPTTLPINLISIDLIQQYKILPLFFNGTNLYLATADPTQYDMFKEVQFYTGLTVYPTLVEADKLTALIDSLSAHKGTIELSEYIENISHSIDEIPPEFNSINEDAPIVKFVNKILFDAIKQGASDIHFELFEEIYRVRYRQDSILYEIATPPTHLAARITARIKIMANLDIANKRLPQDGGFKKIITSQQAIDFRVSTCPTTYGEKVVIRILDPNINQLNIETLGFNLQQQKDFMRAIKRPQGMILVTGPTGSGKTVSLYSALNMLNTNEVNISTVEDPVEIKITGINQVSINPKSGLTFSSILRAFLRQDPDIIMVGEIRDLETAEIAINAAQTGHLVLSTLHTNSASETLNRLLNMGIPSFNIASSITLIIAQRLARKLCNDCKELRYDLTNQDLLKLGFNQEDLNNLTNYKAVGCKRCTEGYRGRIGLFELLPINKQIEALILNKNNSSNILKVAQAEGMLTIYQSGLEKVKQGITTLEEINRVTID